MPVILVCGEALIDLVPTTTDATTYAARPGGSPANVAVALGRLGVDAALLARLAGDGFGRLLREHLLASGVDVGLAIDSPEPTTVAVVNLDAAGKAEYTFYVEGSADSGWQPAELPATLPDATALHVSGALAMALPAMGDTLELLLRRERPHRTITFDPNARSTLVFDEAAYRDRLDRWLHLADVVKVGSDDLGWLAPSEPVPEVAARWRPKGPALVVVTCGEHGVYALGPSGPVELPAVPVEVTDTVGAGDAFMAGLLAALERSDRLSRSRLSELPAGDLVEALTYAQHVAAITCTQVGANPPTSGQVSAWTAGHRAGSRR